MKAVSSEGMVATLFVLQGPDKGRAFRALNGGSVTIGRESEAVPLSDRTISRRHAEIRLEDEAWYIEDLKSANGTYVNGVRLSEPVRLKHGDQIKRGGIYRILHSTGYDRLSGSEYEHGLGYSGQCFQ